MSSLKAALLQYGATDDKTANIAKALKLSQEAIAQKAKFILLPEVFNFRADVREPARLAQAAEKIPGPSVNAFVPLAKKHKTSFLLGSIIEKADGAYAYNTSVFVDAQGRVAAKYRKIHLFDARIGAKIINEADRFKPGHRPTGVNVAGFRAGLSVCYDLRFPGLYQHYAAQAVDLLTVPSCFTRKTGQAHWETLLRARAIENLAYVLAPAQIGFDARGVQAHGHSMIVSPWGEVIAEAGGESEEIVYGVISTDEIKKARRTLPGIIKGA